MNKVMLVKVLWRDASVHNGWSTKDEISDWFNEEDSYNITIGHLVGENDKAMVIGATSDSEGCFNALQYLLKENVHQIRTEKEICLDWWNAASKEEKAEFLRTIGERTGV